MSDWLTTIEALPSVTLVELDERASLQTRVDRKYVVEPQVWVAALASLTTVPEVLEIDGLRSFRYASTYFDTRGLDDYRDAARKRPRRVKVRIRYYLDTGSRAVEVKCRAISGVTVKHRAWLDPGIDPETGPASLPSEAHAFVNSLDAISSTVGDLASVLTTSYTRVTLSVGSARVTVDRDLSAVDTQGMRLDYGDLLVVETKSSSGAGEADRALWSVGARPQRISKYCTSLAALRPELPSNRWSRTLRRHVTDAAIQPAVA